MDFGEHRYLIRHEMMPMVADLFHSFVVVGRMTILPQRPSFSPRPSPASVAAAIFSFSSFRFLYNFV